MNFDRYTQVTHNPVATWNISITHKDSSCFFLVIPSASALEATSVWTSVPQGSLACFKLNACRITYDHAGRILWKWHVHLESVCGVKLVGQIFCSPNYFLLVLFSDLSVLPQCLPTFACGFEVQVLGTDTSGLLHLLDVRPFHPWDGALPSCLEWALPLM